MITPNARKIEHCFGLIRRPALLIPMLVILAGCLVTPQAIDPEEILELLVEDEQFLEESRIPVDGPMTLGEVMARAVLTNLDQKVSDLEEALAFGTFELSRFDMLPSAVASRSYYDRSNDSASRSISIRTGQESLEPSTSQERQHIVDEFRVSWNVLDFGVSYFQAKQEANRFLIASVFREKALIDLIQQARGAYWRALASQEMREPVMMAIAEATVAYEEVSQGIEERIYPNLLEALQQKKELFTLIGDLERLQADLEQAIILLANFINVPSDVELELAAPEELPSLNSVSVSQQILEFTALANSTEVLEQAYNTRIDYDETKKALLRLLPGLELGFTANNDDNRFLFNNDWNEASARLSWNLLRLASTRQTLRSADLREELQIQRRLAANMAVVTRLNIAAHQYSSQLNQLRRAEEIQGIDAQIAELTNNAVLSQSQGQISLIRSQVEALSTNLSFLQTYATTQEAYGTILVSLGLNPLPSNYTEMKVAELAVILDDTTDAWLEGDYPVLHPSVELDPYIDDSDILPADSPQESLLAILMGTVESPSMDEVETIDIAEEVAVREPPALVDEAVVEERTIANQEPEPVSESIVDPVVPAEPQVTLSVDPQSSETGTTTGLIAADDSSQSVVTIEEDNGLLATQRVGDDQPVAAANVDILSNLVVTREEPAVTATASLLESFEETVQEEVAVVELATVAPVEAVSNVSRLGSLRPETPVELEEARIEAELAAIQRREEQIEAARRRAVELQRDQNRGEIRNVIRPESSESATIRRTSTETNAINEGLGSGTLQRDSQIAPLAAVVQRGDAIRDSNSTTAFVRNSNSSGEPQELIGRWLGAWMSRDFEEYLGYYHARFRPPRNQTTESWQAQRQRRLGSAGGVEIGYDKVELLRSSGDRATLRFWIHYESATYEDETQKELELIKDDGSWKIIRETNLEIVIHRA